MECAEVQTAYNTKYFSENGRRLWCRQVTIALPPYCHTCGIFSFNSSRRLGQSFRDVFVQLQSLTEPDRATDSKIKGHDQTEKEGRELDHCHHRTY